MAKLPTVEQLGARPTPQSNRGIVSYDGTMVSKAGKQVGGQLVDMATKQQAADDELSLAQANAQYTIGEAQLKSDIMKNPNYGEWETKYKEGGQKLASDVLGLISSPRARQLAAAKLNAEVATNSITIADKAGESLFKKQSSEALHDPLYEQQIANAQSIEERTKLVNAKVNTLYALGQSQYAPADYNTTVDLGVKKWSGYALSTAPDEQLTPAFNNPDRIQANQEVKQIAMNLKKDMGINPYLTASLYHAETGGSTDLNIKNPLSGSTAQGPLQLTDGTITDVIRRKNLPYTKEQVRKDPELYGKVWGYHISDGIKEVEGKTGKKLSNSEQMLLNFGAGNAIKMLDPANQDKMINDVIGFQGARLANTTVREFSNNWMAKYRGLPTDAPGQLEVGNIDINDLPVYKNEDGSKSTLLSMSREEDGKEVLIRQIVDGKKLTPDQAWDHYKKTGEFLGKFDTPAAADAYGEMLHQQQAQDLAVKEAGGDPVLDRHPINEATGSFLDSADPKAVAAARKRINKLTQENSVKKDAYYHLDTARRMYGDDPVKLLNYASNITDGDTREKYEKYAREYIASSAKDNVKSYEDLTARVMDNFAKGNDVPTDDMMALKPIDRESLDKLTAKQNIKYFENINTSSADMTEYDVQEQLAHNYAVAGYTGPEDMQEKQAIFYNKVATETSLDPMAILKYSVPQLLAELPTDKFDWATSKRKEVLAGKIQPDADATQKTQLINETMAMLGIDTTGKKLSNDEKNKAEIQAAGFRNIFESRLQAYEQTHQKKASFTEMKDMRDDILLQTTYMPEHSWIVRKVWGPWDSDINMSKEQPIKSLFKDPENFKVPDVERNRILMQAQLNHPGKELSDEQIKEIYLDNLKR